MKVIRPSFWNKFQCIGGKCTDNCCIGWEIEIDPETAENYRQVSGELGERLKKSVRVRNGESSFVMNGERCPFLNRENLCDLIIGLGDDALCEICREHPRFYEWFGTWKEAGLGLCCEEAAGLLLAEEKPLEFECVQTEEEEEGFEVESNWLEPLVRIRAVLFAKLQNREKSFVQRIREVLGLAEQVQDCMDREEKEELEQLLQNGQKEKTDLRSGKKVGKEQWTETYEKLLDVFLDMEAMDPKWPEWLKRIREKLPECYANLNGFAEEEKEWAYEWEHLAVYNIFRYFMKAIDDEDVLSKVRMAAAGCALIRLLHLKLWMQNGKVTLRDRVCNVKAYSKEVEYNLENLEKLMDAMWEEEIGGTENLCCVWYDQYPDKILHD